MDRADAVPADAGTGVDADLLGRAAVGVTRTDPGAPADAVPVPGTAGVASTPDAAGTSGMAGTASMPGTSGTASTPGMAGMAGVGEGADRSRPIFLYDGDCSFCSASARFIEVRIPTTADVRAWQHVDLEPLGVTQEEAEAAVQWVAVDGVVRAGPEGIARLLVDAGSFWRPLGWALDLPPVRWLAWPVYRLISRNRHRLPGGTATCALPQAQRDAARSNEL